VLAPLGDFDVFVARLDTTGAPVWAQRWGGTEDDYTFGTTMAPMPGGGAALVLSTMSTSLQIGGEQLKVTVGEAATDLLVVIDAAGQYVWHRQFTGEVEWRSNASLASNAVGDLAVFFRSSPGNQEDESVLSVFDAAGAPKFTRILGGKGWQHAAAVAFTADGFLVAGDVTDEIDLDGPEPVEWGYNSSFIVKFDATGVTQWIKFFQNYSGYLIWEALTVAANGDILFGGSFDLEIDLGGGPLYAMVPDDDCNPDPCPPDEFENCEEDCSNRYDIYVARLDPDGNHIWSTTLGQLYDDRIDVLGATDDDGMVVLWSGIHDNGPTAARIDVLDAAGQSTQSAILSMVGPLRGVSDPAGTAILTGRWDQGVDFGSGKVKNLGEDDFWVAKLTF
jgi:hypothetical protein